MANKPVRITVELTLTKTDGPAAGEEYYGEVITDDLIGQSFEIQDPDKDDITLVEITGVEIR